MAPANMGQQAFDPHAAQLLQTHDLVASLPTPYLRLLILFARPVALFKRVLEVLAWKNGRRVESWMMVGTWWALCLGSGPAFRYLLPPLIFLPLLPLSKLRLKSSSKEPPQNTPTDPSTPESLLRTLADLNAIYGLLPPSPFPTTASIYSRFSQLGVVRLVRGLVVLWATWLILGHFVGFRILLALVGSVILLLPSPPLAHFLNLLSKSLLARRLLALMFLFTFGSPPETSYRFSLHFSLWGWLKSKWTVSRRPSLAFAFRPKMSQPPASGSALATDEDGESEGEAGHDKVENPIYFRFEIHENQRWWMGLDWTSALLPQERPSWCDSHLLPVSPPQAFALPAPVSIVIPTATIKDPYARVLRTASWKWLDDDWSIVRAGPGLGSLPTAIPPSPTVPTDAGDGELVFSIHPQQSATSTTGSGRPSPSISTGLGINSSPPRNTVSLDDHNPAQSPGPGARAQSIAEQAFTKGLERLKARTVSAANSASTSISAGSTSSPARKSGEWQRGRTGSQASEDAHLDELHPTVGTGAVVGASGSGMIAPADIVVEKDDVTDGDGWVYGDNKWENMGPKGGLGKFTRRRRWQRRAVCIETIRRLKPTDDPPLIIPSEPGSGVNTPKSNSEPVAAAAMSSPLKARPAPAVSDTRTQVEGRSSLDGKRDRSEVMSETKSATMTTSMAASGGAGGQSRDDMLRMRLKKAMGSVGG
ncbi:hypothetical protein IAR55_001624 [Kwoniella newhampshirensis]|uniref:Peroxin/Ferlin domain-containing protein n=1 Tax=Kwoniella newhampshirensis TaxID=1651941 RepID=A0AAW0Z2N6_9TREE